MEKSVDQAVVSLLAYQVNALAVNSAKMVSASHHAHSLNALKGKPVIEVPVLTHALILIVNQNSDVSEVNVSLIHVQESLVQKALDVALMDVKLIPVQMSHVRCLHSVEKANVLTVAVSLVAEGMNDVKMVSVSRIRASKPYVLPMKRVAQGYV